MTEISAPFLTHTLTLYSGTGITADVRMQLRNNSENLITLEPFIALQFSELRLIKQFQNTTATRGGTFDLPVSLAKAQSIDYCSFNQSDDLRVLFCFVTDVVPINANTTRFFFEIDSVATYGGEFSGLSAFVLRKEALPPPASQSFGFDLQIGQSEPITVPTCPSYFSGVSEDFQKLFTDFVFGVFATQNPQGDPNGAKWYELSGIPYWGFVYQADTLEELTLWLTERGNTYGALPLYTESLLNSTLKIIYIPRILAQSGSAYSKQFTFSAPHNAKYQKELSSFYRSVDFVNIFEGKKLSLTHNNLSYDAKNLYIDFKILGYGGADPKFIFMFPTKKSGEDTSAYIGKNMTVGNFPTLEYAVAGTKSLTALGAAFETVSVALQTGKAAAEATGGNLVGAVAGAANATQSAFSLINQIQGLKDGINVSSGATGADYFATQGGTPYFFINKPTPEGQRVLQSYLKSFGEAYNNYQVIPSKGYVQISGLVSGKTTIPRRYFNEIVELLKKGIRLDV